MVTRLTKPVATLLFVLVLGVILSSLAQADESTTEQTPARSLAATVKSYDSSWQRSAPIIDGDLSDWEGYPRMVLDKDTASAPSPEFRPEPNDLSAWASIVWDSDYFYVAVYVVDDVIVRDSRNWYFDDMVEFALDMDNDGVFSLGDLLFTVNPGGLITTNGGLSLGVDSVVVNHEKGWLAEFAVPLYQFGSDFLNNAEVGFTWGAQDDDADGLSIRRLVWEGSSARFPSASQGQLRFVDGPSREWVAFRPGVDGYDGIEDTVLNSWPGNQDRNYGSDPTLQLAGRNQWHLLVKVTPPQLPEGARPLKARLHINFTDRKRDDWSLVRMYRLLRPWDENSATWNVAATNDPWTIRGANAIGSDRSDQVIDEVRLDAIDTEYVWDFTSELADLYANPDSNYGFIFRAEEGGNLWYELQSTECTAFQNCAPWLEMYVEFPPPAQE
ncbi:MAG: DNRLRE domain-containing protein [Chloroflexi bacterium]|nr:DNRLRE domain-containing protein [Chloroflexota bacterium]